MVKHIYKRFAVPLWLLSIAMLLQSCVVSQYRVIETQWSESTSEYNESDRQDSAAQVSFWCWSDQGRLRIAVENPTDSILFIDLHQCALMGEDLFFFYSSDTVDFPVYFSVTEPCNSSEWAKLPLVQETCERYLPIAPGKLVVFSKFHLHSALDQSLSGLEFYGESTLYGALNSPAKGAHRLVFQIGKHGHSQTLEHVFFVSARRKWIFKDPHKVYLPENRQHNYYLRSTTLHPAGTFVMLALISFSIHLGTRN